MLSSITPLGERGRGQRWGLTVTAYGLGALAGGLALGLVLGGVAELLAAAGLGPGLRTALAAAAAAVALAFDVPLVRRALPRWRRQVNEDWLSRYRGWVYGVGFGAQLGFGLVTIVVSAVIYLSFVLGALSGSWWGGLAVGFAFGATKAAAVLVAAPVRTPEQLVAFHRRLDRRRPASVRLAAAGDGLALALVVLGLVALGGA